MAKKHIIPPSKGCSWTVGMIRNDDGTVTNVFCGAKTALKTKLCPTHIIAMQAELEEYAMDIRSGKEEAIDL